MKGWLFLVYEYFGATRERSECIHTQNIHTPETPDKKVVVVGEVDRAS